MEKLKVQLPEFMRTIWVSEEARHVWEPRFHQISRAWEDIERLSVGGLRSAALQSVTPDNLTELCEEMAGHGLTVLPLARQGITRGGYQNGTVSYVEGDLWNYRVVIAKAPVALQFLDAWRRQDNTMMGLLLGFPTCCCKYFEWSWVNQGWRDVVLTSMTGETDAWELTFERELQQKGCPENNVFLRHLGVRLVPHLPCSPDCKPSSMLGLHLQRQAHKAGFAKEMHWAQDILRWPLKWSSLHGVAIVTTPVVKVVYNTDALSEKVEIFREGDKYPAEGGRGDFPFRQTVHVVNNSGDNGFQSQEAMLSAHAMVMQGVMSLDIPEGAKVIDLGCGDGQLLERISDIVKVVPVGVESDKKRFQKAEKRLVGRPHQLHCLDLFTPGDWDSSYFLGLISLNRFVEAKPEQAKELLKKLKVNCSHVIFYSYVSNKWTGYPGLTNDFVVERFLTGPNSCAAVMRPVNVDVVKETEHEVN